MGCAHLQVAGLPLSYTIPPPLPYLQVAMAAVLSLSRLRCPYHLRPYRLYRPPHRCSRHPQPPPGQQLQFPAEQVWRCGSVGRNDTPGSH